MMFVNLWSIVCLSVCLSVYFLHFLDTMEGVCCGYEDNVAEIQTQITSTMNEISQIKDCLSRGESYLGFAKDDSGRFYASAT